MNAHTQAGRYLGAVPQEIEKPPVLKVVARPGMAAPVKDARRFVAAGFSLLMVLEIIIISAHILYDTIIMFAAQAPTKFEGNLVSCIFCLFTIGSPII